MTQAASPDAQRTGAGILFLLATVFTFALMEAVVKILGQRYPVPQIVWARYVFHLLLLLPLLVRVGPARLLATRRTGLQIGRSALLFTMTLLFFGAVSLMPLADATAILFAAPLLLTALSVPMLGEHVGPRRWLGILVGFGGVLLIVRPGAGVWDWVAALPLAAAVVYALFQIVTRIASRTEDALTTLFYTALVGAVCMSLAVPFFWVAPGSSDWGLMVLIGLLGGVGQFLFIKAYERAQASHLAPFLYSHLIWATAFGYVLFGDFPSVWTIAGAAIITASGLYIWRREHARA